ncbi:MAG TPA: serine/threonine-protein kinase [Archangium sp.]|uniref:serine/threonine-protein kinase n=1 Tax=Archangium sp. TaxID=1872627 RepID=UPI002E3364E3|nr:serine/threonine-protein kinase [Archangium sp.]HEX5747214.1 serine/threonine-protein kinase [Archangium sp.]
MADSRLCETCGLSVPADTDICPRDGTVLLDASLSSYPGDPGGARRTSPGRTMQVMDDSSAQDPLTGLKVGEYELRQRIGVGGMGLVYEGIQPLIGKRVAVKVLRPELAAAEEQVARLLAEARAVNAIRHRGIVDIFGFGQVPDGRQYIIMEYLEGVALDAHLTEKGRLPVYEALDILDEVLSALGAAHGAGVVHRDLKPSNIFLVKQPDGSRYVKLLDFGLAKMGLPTGRTAQTRTDMVVGTPEYMAPEQARGQPVGPMTDLYALGVVAFEMVTGRLPFTGTSPVDLLMKHVDARPPRPSEFLPELPAALDAFILQMLTKDPEARPGSAEQLRRQLQRLRDTLAQQAQAHHARPTASEHPPREATPEALAPAGPVTPEPGPAPEPVKPQPPPPEVTRDTGGNASSRRLLLGVGALALVAVGGGLVLAVRGGETPPNPPPAVAIAPPEQPAKPPQRPVVEAPPDAGPPRQTAAVPEVSDAGTGTTVQASTTETPDNPVQPAGPAVGHTEPVKRALTQAALLGRIRKLDRDIDTLTQAGQKLSPATRRTLDAIREKAESATTSEERRQVAKELDGWEKFFLRRK